MGAAARQQHDPDNDDVVLLAPDEEAELGHAIAEAEEDERAGLLLPAAVFLEQRGMR